DKAAGREGGRLPRLLAEAGFALDDGNLEAASTALVALREADHRSVAATRLELELARTGGRWDEVLRLVSQLQAQKAIAADEARTLVRAARLAGFHAAAGDADGVAACWQGLSKEEMADRALVTEVLPLLADVGQGGLARRTVERLLDTQWDSVLARLYFACAGEGEDALQALKRAEKWLPLHADDAGLLASLGRQCIAAQ